MKITKSMLLMLLMGGMVVGINENVSADTFKNPNTYNQILNMKKPNSQSVTEQ